jgi:hypothetical protein
MKTYISGYYCRDDLHLQVMNKESNRKILEALKDAYPSGLTAEELAKITKLPIKTIYAQKSELYREYYINHLEDETEEHKRSRGRPSIQRQREMADDSVRKRVRIVIEEANGVHDKYEGKKPVPLPPGNVVYSPGFIDACHQLITLEDQEDLFSTLIQFVARILNRTNEYDDRNGGLTSAMKWVPERSTEFCCTQCGLNHEARDFIRAMLLHLIDKLESNSKFIDLLFKNQFLTNEAYGQVQKG